GPLPHADQLDLDPPLPVGLGTRVVDLEPEVPLQRVAVATATTSRDQMLGRGPERDPARSLGEQLEMTTATQRGIVTRRRMAQRQSHARASWMLLLLVLFLGVLLVFFLVVLLLALLLGAGAGEAQQGRGEDQVRERAHGLICADVATQVKEIARNQAPWVIGVGRPASSMAT